MRLSSPPRCRCSMPSRRCNASCSAQMARCSSSSYWTGMSDLLDTPVRLDHLLRENQPRAAVRVTYVRSVPDVIFRDLCLDANRPAEVAAFWAPLLGRTTENLENGDALLGGA